MVFPPGYRIDLDIEKQQRNDDHHYRRRNNKIEESNRISVRRDFLVVVVVVLYPVHEIVDHIYIYIYMRTCNRNGSVIVVYLLCFESCSCSLDRTFLFDH
jgi:hypothetical protein